MRVAKLLFVAMCCLYAPARAGEFNQVLSVGDVAPDWQKLPGVDGKMHSRSDFDEKTLLVVAFTCVSCPTAVDYEARLQALAETWGAAESPVGVVAVCVNRVEQDRLPALQKNHAAKKLTYTCLYDESQEIAKSFGAIFTPEFYVLDRERRVVYMGAFDDQTDAAQVTQPYVKQAIEATLAGQKPAVAETIARGCRVRYARERR